MLSSYISYEFLIEALIYQSKFYSMIIPNERQFFPLEFIFALNFLGQIKRQYQLELLTKVLSLRTNLQLLENNFPRNLLRYSFSTQ